MKVEITKRQLEAICTAGDILSAMTGVGEDETDKEFSDTVKFIDRFLKKNSLNRDFN